jgi:hypothetical protein
MAAYNERKIYNLKGFIQGLKIEVLLYKTDVFM